MQQHGTGGVPGGDTGGDTSDTVCGVCVCVWGGGEIKQGSDGD